MAQPTPYNRVVNFQDLQALSPSTPLPGQSVDAEFNAVANTFNEILTNLAILQRDDTALANESVGFDQLKAELLVGINPATVWAAGTQYVVGDTVISFTSLYRAIESHVSTSDFSEDLNTGFWELLLDLATDPLSLSGDITVDSEGVVTIADNAVSNGKLAQGSARSVIGVTGNSTNNRADIVATADTILRGNGAGTGIGFGSIDLSKSAAVGSSILALSNGGTGADDAASARTALELGAAAVAGVSNDVTLGDDSETDLVTEHAVKTFAETLLATGFVDLDPVRVATTVNGVMNSDYEDGDTVDGVALATGDRILIKNNANPVSNGIYTVEASGIPTRATDNDESDEFVGRQVLVLEGTANAATKWKCSNTEAPEVGTDPITWVQTQAANSYLAGSGLTLNGQEFAIDIAVVPQLAAGNTFVSTNPQIFQRDSATTTTVSVGGAFTNQQTVHPFQVSNPSDTGNKAGLALNVGTTSSFRAFLFAEKTGAQAGKAYLAARRGSADAIKIAEWDESGNYEIEGALKPGDVNLTYANLRAIPRFPTIAAAQAEHLTGYGHVYTEGYILAGDGGHGYWRNKSGSEPSHAAKWQDQDGNWFEPNEEIVNTRQIGMKLDGATDDRTAWQTVIGMLNSGVYKDIKVPPGNSAVSGGVLDEITANGFSLMGSGRAITTVTRTGTTNANIFAFGSSSVTAVEFYFGGMTLDFGSLSGTPAGTAANLNNVSRGHVRDLAISQCAHGIGLGHIANETDCRQSDIDGLRVLLKNEAGGAAINDVGSNNFKLQDFFISNIDDTTNHSCRGIWMHPGAGRGGDAWKVMNGEINLTNGNAG